MTPIETKGWKMKQRTYLCIDLKSFYASVECVERGLDPMTTNLVVADPERSRGTICLAITPAMKKLGVRNRCRIYEIPKEISYLTAVPRMRKYMDYAGEIYKIYLETIAPDDIHVYSIDEAFLDVTEYLERERKTPREMAEFLMGEVLKKTGIRSTCGIGSNLYLSKIALDLTAKKAPDFIGILDEERYRRELWDYRPLTDFWRIGNGTAARLRSIGVETMRELALSDETQLYRLFGIDAELLIDHAWGRESATMADIKHYRSRSESLSSGQVLLRDYNFEEAELIVKEMADLVCLDMVKKHRETDLYSLAVSYSHTVPVPAAHGSVRLPIRTNADSVVIPALVRKYREIVRRDLPIRRITIDCGDLSEETGRLQLNLFQKDLERKLRVNHQIQETVLQIKHRFGKNAILKGMNFEAAGTTRERNGQIGGHKAYGQTSSK